MLSDAKKICLNAIESCLPVRGVTAFLSQHKLDDVFLVAVGKAAPLMAEAAINKVKIRQGIVLSKYHHFTKLLNGVECFEAGHPLTDENGIRATEKIIEMCRDLKADDKVLFLLSGGASALFEKPLIPLNELQNLNEQMLRKGLNITEINTIRKKLSAVKGGRFADLCRPAKVCSVILSDVLEDKLDVIGSGPTVRDESSGEDALRIIDQYGIRISKENRKLISLQKSSMADNAENHIIGSVKILCQEAMKEAEKLGYQPVLLNDHLDCEADEAGDYLYHEILKYRNQGKIALIMGGETIVHVKGNGLGGRNQQLVFSQIEHLKDMDDVLIMSLGSDGTDGPTDAAGGYIDGQSYNKLKQQGIDYKQILENNDSYNGLKAIDGLIMTGPTGTNVNDISIALIN